MSKNEVIYNPLEDTDVNLPIYKKDGKNLIMPAFICGVRTKDITSRAGDELKLVELEFEIHESAEKIEVQIYHENEEGNYNYRAPKETVNGSTFIGFRVKSSGRGNLWKNLTKGSGKMNRILLESLKSIGIEIKTKKIKHDGKDIQAPIIPELNEELLLGYPVFIWLDEESFTGKNGKNVSYTCVTKYAKMDNAEKVTVLENSFNESNKTSGSSSKKDDDPFGDIDDDLPF